MKYLLITLMTMTGLMAQDPPEFFSYNNSQSQAFYFFITVTIDGAAVASDDWVAAFNGDVCVGARKWDTSQCGNGICDVPAMGDDGSEYTDGYIMNDDIPSFKIFDASENTYYDAISSSDVPAFHDNEWYYVDALQNDGTTGSCDADGGVDDCAGVCGGDALIDECGECGGDGIDEGACDCDGNVLDECGECGGDGSSCADCAGVPNGDNVEDNCGTCDADPANDCIPDCNGDWGGSAVEDECGVCGGDGIADGECDCDGNTLDECGICGGDNSTCLDCAGTPNGDAEFDCAGECGGTCDDNDCDECGICNGDGSSCAAPTWRLQLVAEVDSWDQFKNTGNPDWLLSDDQNFLGAAVGGSWGYDENHDILEPAANPGNYVSLFFDHPEWDTFWGSHFTEDIVHDNDDFFSTNLTQWNGTVVSNVPGTTLLTLFVETGDSILQASTYEMYLEVDGEYTRISDTDSTTVDFYMDGSGQQDFSVFIGNIVPQAPDGLVATPDTASITLDWADAASSDLGDISNRYPALTYNVYRDDEPRDPNSNQTTYAPGDGPDGCGGLLSAGQSETSYLDDANLYGIGEGLLQESEYGYTVTASNLAGESSHGHTIRMSGSAEEFFDGRDSRAQATTDDNADPVVRLANVESPTTEPGQNNETNIGEGHYEIPHNFDPDENRITISIDGSGSDDDDYPYGIDRYTWTQTAGDYTLQEIVGDSTNTVTFTVGNPHENGAKSYTWNLHVETDHPVKDGGVFHAGSCSEDGSNIDWTTKISTHVADDSISVTIDEEPNADPVASGALDLIRAGDNLSVITMNNYAASDFNDYDGNNQAWYEPHDGNGADNDADLWFSAFDSDDADGECDGTAGETGCDSQFYTWTLTQGVLAGFYYDDLNGDGQYNFGEPYTLLGGDEIYEDSNLGDYNVSGPAATALTGTCSTCTDGQYTGSASNASDGSYNYHGRDLHLALGSGDTASGSDAQEVYILSMTVKDIYDDSSSVSLLVLVRDERNSLPAATTGADQMWYMETDYDDFDITMSEHSVADSDGDELAYSWSYAGNGIDDGQTSTSGELPQASYNSLPNPQELVEGTHTFELSVSDNYGAGSSDSFSIEIKNEPSPVAVTNLQIDDPYNAFKHIQISWNEGVLVRSDFDLAAGTDYNGDGTDDPYSYTGVLNNTLYFKVYMNDVEKDTYQNDDGDGATYTHHEESLPADTDHTFRVEAFNSDDEGGANDDASHHTHARPTVTVVTPNGLEIASETDLYNVEFTTTNDRFIDHIDIEFKDHAGWENEDDDEATISRIATDGNNNGTYAASVESEGVDGEGFHYDASIRITVTDIGDYNGSAGSVQDTTDASNDPFTLAAHSLYKTYSAGWHLFGPALEIYGDQLDLVTHLEGPDNMGNWGQDWVAFDVSGNYDGLKLNIGEGYYLAVAEGATMEVRGNPVTGDPNSPDEFSGGTLSLDKGWNLIANPLVNKISKETLTINDGNDDKGFEDAVDAGWIAPTVYGWFEGGYSSIDRLMPFGGYWINTSRGLTIKVRPHLFDDDELTRKADEVVATSILELRARDISGEGVSDFITVGLLDNADDKFVYGEDEYDLPRQAYTSMGGEYIDMKIGSDLMKDMKSSEYDDFQAWTISIATEKIDNDIELSWGDVSAFDDDLHIVINGEAINMHEENYIELTSMIEEVAIVVGNVDSYLNPIPGEFGLSAAYPNPFNPTTTLGLALDVDGFVSMSVFNIRGQVVEVLVGRNMKAGYHNVVWNADGISSGMYFVRVETGANTAMQKLMLLK